MYTLIMLLYIIFRFFSSDFRKNLSSCPDNTFKERFLRKNAASEHDRRITFPSVPAKLPLCPRRMHFQKLPPIPHILHRMLFSVKPYANRPPTPKVLLLLLFPCAVRGLSPAVTLRSGFRWSLKKIFRRETKKSKKSLTNQTSCAIIITVKGTEHYRLGICVTAARQTLTLFEGVQIPHSQP